MQDFVAIDFETANGRRSSVCSVGIVIVRDGVIVDRFYSLIQPAPNYYTYWTPINQEVNFTDAKVSYEYEEPLGEQ